MAVTFLNLQRTFTCDQPRLERHASWALFAVGRSVSDVTIVLVNDRRMRALNTTYRGKRKTTDVLSFESGPPLPGITDNAIGEIVISPARAMNQSRELNISFEDELTNLVIHGLCHLLGYDHESSETDAREMKAVEEKMARMIRRKDKNLGDHSTITGKIPPVAD